MKHLRAIEACQTCAVECERFAQWHSACRRCAEACRHCADECERISYIPLNVVE